MQGKHLFREGLVFICTRRVRQTGIQTSRNFDL